MSDELAEMRTRHDIIFAELLKLRAERDAALADAARYRILRHNHRFRICWNDGHYWITLTETNIEDRIDAALREEA